MSTSDKENDPIKHDETMEQVHFAAFHEQRCHCEQKSLAQVGGSIVTCFTRGNLGKHSNEKDPIASVVTHISTSCKPEGIVYPARLLLYLV